jgi:hypothetical protein
VDQGLLIPAQVPRVEGQDHTEVVETTSAAQHQEDRLGRARAASPVHLIEASGQLGTPPTSAREGGDWKRESSGPNPAYACAQPNVSRVTLQETLRSRAPTVVEEHPPPLGGGATNARSMVYI